ncbi:glycosyltransferase family 2 protein [Nostoc sp. FACHB-892]|uniref:glycosyltransferase family 2 protein n=1 Tax=Nostoc sp. FACHB-892 TaxID=2692843 RepID=UPI00168A364F|nr:glycosyltransferase family A protein [Nostoc sp. FACHB-892]MBD2730342.1 glycosyltransferase family 2 protein [Nostoc sp. FACHB-892]
MPKISVVIPAYNAEPTIKKTIESVQKQSFSDFEVIIINDGSIDRTLEIIHSIDDSRLRIFSYQNGGLSVARNRGISHATGEFIAFLDADDLWTSDKLELQLAVLEQHPEVGIAYSWTYFMNEKENCLFPGSPLFYEGNVYRDLLIKNFLSHGSNPLIRKEVIESVGEFDTQLSHFADWDYWLRIASKWSFAVVPKYQIYYFQSSRTMSSKADGIKEAGYFMIEKAFRSAPKELQSLKKISYSKLLLYCTDLYFQHSTDINGIRQGRDNLLNAIRLHPQSLLSKDTQKLVVRFIFIRLFPTQIASYLLQVFRKFRKIPQYQVQR